MACLGFGWMSSFIRQINTFLPEFEREPGYEQRGKKRKKAALYAWWLTGGNEGWRKDWSALVPSQAVAVTLTTPHPSPWLLLLIPGLVVGKGCAFGCCWMHPLLVFFWGTGRRCTQLAPRQNVKPLSGATVDCGLWSSEFNCKG